MVVVFCWPSCALPCSYPGRLVCSIATDQHFLEKQLHRYRYEAVKAVLALSEHLQPKSKIQQWGWRPLGKKALGRRQVSRWAQFALDSLAPALAARYGPPKSRDSSSSGDGGGITSCAGVHGAKDGGTLLVGAQGGAGSPAAEAAAPETAVTSAIGLEHKCRTVLPPLPLLELNEHCRTRDWIAGPVKTGGYVSVADLVCWVVLRRYTAELAADQAVLVQIPQIQRWYRAVNALPAVAKVAESALSLSFASATAFAPTAVVGAVNAGVGAFTISPAPRGAPLDLGDPGLVKGQRRAAEEHVPISVGQTLPVTLILRVLPTFSSNLAWRTFGKVARVPTIADWPLGPTCGASDWATVLPQGTYAERFCSRFDGRFTNRSVELRIDSRTDR
jgi:hypothetical protein